MSLLDTLTNLAERKGVTISDITGEAYLRDGYYSLYNAYTRGGIQSTRALQLSAFYAGVKIISEDLGSCPLLTRELAADGSHSDALSHPLYTRMRFSPNPDMTAMQFRETLTAHAIMTGTGYATKEFSRGDAGRIIAMWPIQPDNVTKDTDRAGRTYYLVKEQGKQQRTLTSQQMFRLDGFGLTGKDGLNLLTLAKDILGLANAQQDYAQRFFAQDQTPNIVLKTLNKMTPEAIQNVKRAWAGIGPDGQRRPQDDWHAPKVAPEGLEPVQLHPDNQKSQLVDQRVFQILEICRLLRMPPHKLAELGRATWANIGDENLSYTQNTLRPWAVRWEMALKLQLLGIDTPFYCEHDFSELERGNFSGQVEGLTKLQDRGDVTQNEVRAEFNFNPIEGGDMRIVPLNFQTVAQAAAAAISRRSASRRNQEVMI